MSEEPYEQILKDALNEFQKHSKDGETLVLDGENVKYGYFREDQNPSYVGYLHDRVSFKRSALIELIERASSSPYHEASLVAECLREDLDNIESMDTGSKPGLVHHILLK